MIKCFNLLPYITKKVLNLLRMRALRNHQYRPGVFLFGQHCPNRQQRILFYLNNSEFVHPGDHLFFEPAIRWLKQLNYAVYVNPTKLMAHYFQANDYQLTNHIEQNDLIITRPELLPEIKDQCANVICFDTACWQIDQPIINYLISTLAALFKVSIDDQFNYRPSSMVAETSLNLTDFDEHNYVLFNNYISSGRFRVGKQKYQKLAQFAKQFKQQHHCKIIHIGSSNDLLQDKNIYDFVDVDLRGKTTIGDLFILANLANVNAAISFDSFTMHLMALNNKPAYVLFRGRWTARAKNYILNYVNPPFITPEKKIEYID